MTSEVEKPNRISALLNNISHTNVDVALICGFKLLLKVVGNILAEPSESKFRVVKKTNKALHSRLFSLRGGMEPLMIQMGFRQVGLDSLLYEGHNFTVLRNAVNMIEKLVNPINEAHEEKQEMLREN
jgi:hypothetical protein